MKLVYNIVLLSLGLFIAIYSYGCKETISDTNVDQNIVTIGNQVWMTKNLDVSTFRNGDPIFEARTMDEWYRAGDDKRPAWCYYENDPANGTKYGKLYNWYAVNDPRGLVPNGWHVPSDEEWTVLTNYLGGAENAGAKMKSKTGWFQEGNGTNSSGFSGLPGGERDGWGTFYEIGNYGSWWSSTEVINTYTAWSRYLRYNVGNAFRDSIPNYKNFGLSVRCLKD